MREWDQIIVHKLSTSAEKRVTHKLLKLSNNKKKKWEQRIKSG